MPIPAWSWFKEIIGEGGLTRVAASITAQGQVELPYSIRGVRDSLAGSEGQWIFWVCLLAPVLVLVVTAFLWWRKHRQDRFRGVIDDPEVLFEGLLARVELVEEDKDILREMTRAARLRHPATCLLSPALLDWSRRVWLTEEKPEAVPAEKASRIDEISTKLYDHVTPSTIRQIQKEMATISE